MGLGKSVKQMLRHVLKYYDYDLIKISKMYEWQKSFTDGISESRFNEKTKLPEEAENYLQIDNRRLKELQERYSQFERSVTTPLVWNDDHIKPDDLKYFRGDNAYVWQKKGQNMHIIGYLLSTQYVKSIDTLGLLERLEEDNDFGAFTFLIDNKIISRDLLDSIMEIYFLETHLNISTRPNLNILDIGAGYGRLAHRMAKALPNLNTYFCSDAVSTSTFLSEYYLRFRNVDNKAKVIPLDQIEDTLSNHPVDLAINIHSFPECTVSAIEWWLTLLEKNRVKYLMIVPNKPADVGNLFQTVYNEDFSKVIEERGYKLIAKKPKYKDPLMQEHAIMPAYYHLFELS